MRLVFSALCFGLLALGALGRYQPNWSSLDKRPLPDWYDQSKIGIFLHWGLYSVPGYGTEWMWAYWKGGDKDIVNFMDQNYKPTFQYQDFAPMFTAEFYNPQQWVELFEASGAKYVVLTSKHHEGYTMWPSKYSWNWNCKDVGSNRDLLGDLAEAVRMNSSLHFGIYYSLYEWYNPLYIQDKNNKFKTQYFVQQKMIPEMVDLVTAYNPDVFWVDGDWEASDQYFNSTNFLAWLYNDSPVKDSIAVNDRWGIGIPCHHGGYYTCSDRYNPGVLQDHKFEGTMTLDLNSWGYRRNVTVQSIKKIQDVIKELVQMVSCGGNVLVNLGPTGDGRIIPIFEERLRQMGSWLKVNGEAIYKSTPWKVQNDTMSPQVWYTQRQDLNAVYATILQWPENSILTLYPQIENGVSDIVMLGASLPVRWTETSSGILNVTLPVPAPNQDPSKWAWVLKITLTNELNSVVD